MPWRSSWLKSKAMRVHVIVEKRMVACESLATDLQEYLERPLLAEPQRLR